jgi:hypothetical protein
MPFIKQNITRSVMPVPDIWPIMMMPPPPMIVIRVIAFHREAVPEAPGLGRLRRGDADEKSDRREGAKD